MTVSRGRVHKYLRMTLDYTAHGQVNISMLNYVDEIINAFDMAEPKGAGTKSSAPPDDLFKVDEDREKLLLKRLCVSQPGGQDTICHQIARPNT